MICPACNTSNLPGTDRCYHCLSPFSKLDIPLPTAGLQKRLMEDTVAALKPRMAVTGSAETPLDRVVQLLKEKGVGCVLVLDGECLVGILSEKDVLYKLGGKDNSLNTIKTSEIMTSNPVTVNMDDSIRFVLHQMSIGGFRHIPITSRSSPPKIISVRDVLGYMCKSVTDIEPKMAGSLALKGLSLE